MLNYLSKTKTAGVYDPNRLRPKETPEKKYIKYMKSRKIKGSKQPIGRTKAKEYFDLEQEYPDKVDLNKLRFYRRYDFLKDPSKSFQPYTPQLDLLEQSFQPVTSYIISNLETIKKYLVDTNTDLQVLSNALAEMYRSNSEILPVITSTLESLKTSYTPIKSYEPI